MCTRTKIYPGVQNVCFSKNLVCIVFLQNQFWAPPFCLITDKMVQSLYIWMESFILRGSHWTSVRSSELSFFIKIPKILLSFSTSCFCLAFNWNSQFKCLSFSGFPEGASKFWRTKNRKIVRWIYWYFTTFLFVCPINYQPMFYTNKHILCWSLQLNIEQKLHACFTFSNIDWKRLNFDSYSCSSSYTGLFL